VANLEVNGGSLQRSRVTTVAVHFVSPIIFTGSAVEAFALQRQSDGKSPNLAAIVDPTNTVVTLTFLPGDAVDSSSLADGRYTLSVFAAKFGADGLDGDRNGAGGGNYELVGSPAAEPR
jgi:hypothetical protein